MRRATLQHSSWGTVERTFNVTVPTMPPCHVCKTCQAKRVPHPRQAARASKAGQLTHADTWGPFLSTIYYEGCRYIVVFSDNYSKYRFPVFMKDRTTGTLLEAWRLYYAHMRSLNVDPAAWASDGGPE